MSFAHRKRVVSRPSRIHRGLCYTSHVEAAILKAHLYQCKGWLIQLFLFVMTIWLHIHNAKNAQTYLGALGTCWIPSFWTDWDAGVMTGLLGRVYKKAHGTPVYTVYENTFWQTTSYTCVYSTAGTTIFFFFLVMYCIFSRLFDLIIKKCFCIFIYELKDPSREDVYLPASCTRFMSC